MGKETEEPQSRDRRKSCDATREVGRELDDDESESSPPLERKRGERKCRDGAVIFHVAKVRIAMVMVIRD